MRTIVDEGAALPFSDLESRILPARVAGYEPEMLDALAASGEVLWVGAGRIGERDGRIRLVRGENLAYQLTPATAEVPTGTIPDRIREVLATRGASFFPAIARAVGGLLPPAV